MSEEVNKNFVCIWKIEHFNFYNSYHWITTPVFTIENLGGAEWRLLLFSDGNQVKCSLNQLIPKKPENAISFRYELTSPEGVLLMASKQFSYNFARNLLSEEVFLIKRDKLAKEMSSWSEDTVILRFYIDYADDVTLPVSTCQVITDFSERFSFLTDLNYSNELAKKQISLFDIPVEISFQCINSSLVCNFLSGVFWKDGEELCALVSLLIVDTKGSILNSDSRQILFSQNNVKEKYALDFTKKKIEMRNKIRIKIEILIPHRSIVTYDKLRIGRDKNSENENSKTTSKKEVNASPLKVPQQLQEKESTSKTDDECLFYLQKHLRSMFLDKKFTDVKLRVGNEVFCAHKSLLAARSPVFSAMFDKDMSESNTGIVDIIDVEANSMKSFLEYIYTGTVEEMNYDVALNLLVMSDKYEVSPLTRKCSNFLKSALSHSNVCEVLSIADLINHEELKSAAMDYILENSTTILSSLQWAQWLKSNTALASEVFLKMSIIFDGGAMEHENRHLEVQTKFTCQLQRKENL